MMFLFGLAVGLAVGAAAGWTARRFLTRFAWKQSDRWRRAAMGSKARDKR